jgi:hypothetical protein
MTMAMLDQHRGSGSGGCQIAARIAEAPVADTGHLARSRFFAGGSEGQKASDRGSRLPIRSPSRVLLASNAVTAVSSQAEALCGRVGLQTKKSVRCRTHFSKARKSQFGAELTFLSTEGPPGSRRRPPDGMERVGVSAERHACSSFPISRSLCKSRGSRTSSAGSVAGRARQLFLDCDRQPIPPGPRYVAMRPRRVIVRRAARTINARGSTLEASVCTLLTKPGVFSTVRRE